MPKSTPEFPSEALVEELAERMLAALPPRAAEILARAGIDPRDQIRFHAVATRCRDARERRDLTIKSAAAALKIAQYRLKDIEGGQIGRIDPRALSDYVAFLGLERWFARWRAQSPDLAARLGVAARDRGRKRAPSRPAARGGPVLQFRVELQEVVPPVCRVIQVPSAYTFWDLHVAIQDAMGWSDSHLHEFEVSEPMTGTRVHIGIPDDDFPDERPTAPGWDVPIAPYFDTPGTVVEYLYDFGDDWHHRVTFEGAHARKPRTRYPLCLDGRHACPPEDVGGPHGYEEFLAAIADPEHEEHDTMLTWVGGTFDPTRFSAAAVRFDDPRARWRVAFGGGVRG